MLIEEVGRPVEILLVEDNPADVDLTLEALGCQDVLRFFYTVNML